MEAYGAWLCLSVYISCYIICYAYSSVCPCAGEHVPVGRLAARAPGVVPGRVVARAVAAVQLRARARLRHASRHQRHRRTRCKFIKCTIVLLKIQSTILINLPVSKYVLKNQFVCFLRSDCYTMYFMK